MMVGKPLKEEFHQLLVAFQLMLCLQESCHTQDGKCPDLQDLSQHKPEKTQPRWFLDSLNDFLQKPMAFPLPSIAETQILPKKGHQKNTSLSQFFQYNYV